MVGANTGISVQLPVSDCVATRVVAGVRVAVGTGPDGVLVFAAVGDGVAEGDGVAVGVEITGSLMAAALAQALRVIAIRVRNDLLRMSLAYSHTAKKQSACITGLATNRIDYSRVLYYPLTIKYIDWRPVL